MTNVPATATSAVPQPTTDTALLLDGMVNMIDLARQEGNTVLRELPRTTGLFQVVDLVTAIGHLRQAAVLIDRCADALDAEAVR